MKIINFYIFNAPILKNGTSNGFNKSLKDYGWGTTQNNANKLERSLLKASKLGNFIFLKSSTIENTIDSMDLNSSICISHERAVLKLNGKVTAEEDGSFVFTESETRMESLFRHIRNSFAHNRTYIFDNDFILLEDCDDSNKITAKILIEIKTLLKWIDVITGINKK